MTERIDAFTHVLTEHFYDVLVEEHDFKGLSGSPSWLWELEPRFEDMEDYGVDKQVINLALPPIWQGMDPEEALPLVQLANDEVARLADEHPDKFVEAIEPDLPEISGEVFAEERRQSLERERADGHEPDPDVAVESEHDTDTVEIDVEDTGSEN